MEELDKNFTSLVQSEALFSLTEPGKMNALKALVNKSIPNEQRKKDESSRTQKIETINQVCLLMKVLDGNFHSIVPTSTTTTSSSFLCAFPTPKINKKPRAPPPHQIFSLACNKPPSVGRLYVFCILMLSFFFTCDVRL